MKLTPKQEKFCREYVKNGNVGSQAYRAAYNASNMKHETIAKKACGLLKQENIRGMVQTLKDKADKRLNKKFEIDVDLLLEQLTKIATTGEKDSDKVNAIKELLKVTGTYEKHNEQKKSDQTTKINFTRGPE